MRFTRLDIDDLREAARYSLAISQGVKMVSPMMSAYVRHHEALAMRLERLASAIEGEINAGTTPPEGPT